MLAIVDTRGSHSYSELDAAAEAVEAALRSRLAPHTDPGSPPRVALHLEPGLGYAAGLLGTWRAGAIAVPLCLAHPAAELAYVLEDTRPSVVAGDAGRRPELAGLARNAGSAFLAVDDTLLTTTGVDSASEDGGAPSNCTGVQVDARSAGDAATGLGRDALILYTSGTTGRPKGVMLSHGNLAATVEALVAAWGWGPHDRIVHVLPLHHTHGIVNALLCPLRVGAVVDMLPAFDAAAVWDRFAAGDATLFMAVPTVYVRLIREWDAADEETRRRWGEGARGLRLMVSGSAALPVPVLERWREITGHTLLERYGMTEIGMALSNPLEGERRPGHVGTPLPGVELRLVDADERPVAPGEPGEIRVRGPAVFREYWERPAETAAAFHDGWFRTGDVAVLEDGAYRILGRRSVDIIKTGGYKVSALEIENVLGGHPDVIECAVVGIPDVEWGEVVAAAIVARCDLPRDTVRDWARDRLAPYKLPRHVRCVDSLPKNAMGKVTKPEVRALFAGPGQSQEGES